MPHDNLEIDDYFFAFVCSTGGDDDDYDGDRVVLNVNVANRR